MSNKSFNTFLKKVGLIYRLNALLKSYQLKRNLQWLTSYYQNKADIDNISYVESAAIAAFKDRHLQLHPNYVARDLGSLNIFWVGASLAQDESGFLQALERLGKVTRFYNGDGAYGPHYQISGLDWLSTRKINDDLLLEQVQRAHYNHNIDFLIGQMWSHIYSETALLKVRSLGIPVINIAMDDRLPNLWATQDGERMGAVGLSSGVDMTLTTAPEVCTWYATENMPAVFWPLASDKHLFVSKQDTPKDIDILFIGNRYGIRGKLIKYLEDHGIQVSCYGNGWSNGYVNAETNISLSRRSRIILGIGSIGHCSDVYTLKLRDFDALMTGALYITHRNPDLLRLFNEGEHLECYSNLQELVSKLKYYLNHPHQCKTIGTQGQALAQSCHSWDYRLTRTFKQLGLLS